MARTKQTARLVGGGDKVAQRDSADSPALDPRAGSESPSEREQSDGGSSSSASSSKSDARGGGCIFEGDQLQRKRIQATKPLRGVRRMIPWRSESDRVL